MMLRHNQAPKSVMDLTVIFNPQFESLLIKGNRFTLRFETLMYHILKFVAAAEPWPLLKSAQAEHVLYVVSLRPPISHAHTQCKWLLPSSLHGVIVTTFVPTSSQVQQWNDTEEVTDGSHIHQASKNALEQHSFTLSRTEEEVCHYLCPKQIPKYPAALTWLINEVFLSIQQWFNVYFTKFRPDYLHKQTHKTDDKGKFFLSASGALLTNPIADVNHILKRLVLHPCNIYRYKCPGGHLKFVINVSLSHSYQQKQEQEQQENDKQLSSSASSSFCFQHICTGHGYVSPDGQDFGMPSGTCSLWPWMESLPARHRQQRLGLKSTVVTISNGEKFSSNSVSNMSRVSFWFVYWLFFSLFSFRVTSFTMSCGF